MTSTLDEEDVVRLIWKRISKPLGRDPFDDDVAWIPGVSSKLFIVKADMLVAATDCPKQMTASEIAKKAVTSCVSDFAAKGVKPSYCVVSIGLPKKLASKKFVSALGEGLANAQNNYGLKIIAGDMSATSMDLVIDCSALGFSHRIVKRNGARPGDLVGVSGSFGHQSAGLLLLMGRARSRDSRFKKLAIRSVLEPTARLELGTRISPYLSSSIDSSDGLALSLYHLAESSHVSIELNSLPTSEGVKGFAKRNRARLRDLVLFGGEEYEIVCTFDPKHRSLLESMGVLTIGRVVKESATPTVSYEDNQVQRRGWLHFQ